MSRPIRETHTGGVVKVAHQAGRWGAVPQALLEDENLELDTRAVAAWLATRPPGWVISITHLRARLRLGKEKWRRIARELEAGGYLSRACHPGEGGRWVWEIIFNPIPHPAVVGPAVVGSAAHGSAVAGAAGCIYKTEGDKPVKKNQEEKSHARSARAPAGARGAPSLLVDGNGIHYQEGNELDAATLSKIYEFHPSQIAAAVKQAREKDPRGRAFPSSVARILLSKEEEVPPWMRAVLSHVGSDVNSLGVENE